MMLLLMYSAGDISLSVLILFAGTSLKGLLMEVTNVSECYARVFVILRSSVEYFGLM